MEELLRIGVITTTHGIRGEVKVFPTTDDPRRFDQCKEVVLVTKKEQIPLHVEKVKYFKNLVILKFKEYNDINQVEQFRKCDIIGAEVVEEDGTTLGTVKDVMDTGANQVFVIASPEGRELLFPSIPDCIKKVDTENKQVVAHVMPGLMDL